MGVLTRVREVGGWLGDRLAGRRSVRLQPPGGLRLLDEGDGKVERRLVGGALHVRPADDSYHLYFQLPQHLLSGAIFVEVEYLGTAHGPFKLQYPTTTGKGALGGRYLEAPQLWPGDPGEEQLRRCRYTLLDFDGTKVQNYGAHFRLVMFSGAWIHDVRVSDQPLSDAERYSGFIPDVALVKAPDRFHKIQWLFVELTNLCNFSCTFCPDEIMERKRGWMKTEKVLAIFDQIAAQRGRLGPVWPVKLHQMGEPTIHPDIVAIVEHAEKLGIGIELNTNCSLLKPSLVEGLYRAGLTNLVLSYLNHTPEAFGTRKVKNSKLTFDQYRADIERTIETKFALGARTHIELHIANAKYAGGFEALVRADEEAVAEVETWLDFARRVESQYGLRPSGIDPERLHSFNVLDHDENGSILPILPGVDLMWKRIHNWGNVIGASPERGPAYCMVPYEQFVIQYSGDVTVCCTDYEGGIRVGNIFEQSIEDIWNGSPLRKLREEMLGGVLSNPVCRTCRGWES
jgi:radical SAM protein with 4Fe4S-binding SPASM domain